MTTKARIIRGRQSQAIAAEYLRDRGWPRVEPVEPFFSGRDLKHMGRVAVEIKATAASPFPAALAQAARHADDGDLPAALWRPDGYGEQHVADWVLALRFGDGAAVLRAAGYGWPE
jgi:hypothetical protein